MTTSRNARPKWTPNLTNQRVAPILQEELENFETEIDRFRNGEWAEEAFVAIRLRQGIYGQRQPDRQMVRVKIPFGGVTAEQFEALGVVAERFAPLEKGHVTTRENVQFHHVLLADVPELLRIIGDAGLTTREACGNTMRNVTGCAKAGVCPDETFDVTPYAGAYSRYFLRHPVTQAMPRKVKTAFSGCASDCAITPVHDVGFLPRIKDGKRGFKMVVGGGLSIMPRMAPTLYEFVSADEYLTITEACMRVFDRQDQERKNRMKARIKFTVDRMGIDEFRRLVEEELEQPWAQHPVDLESLLFIEDEEKDAPPAPSGATAVSYVNGSGPADFQAWKQTNVEPQRQPGYNVVHIKLDRGDIYAEQWQPLASISREFAGGRARLDVQQNVVFRWVRTESLFDVYTRLKDIGLADPGRHTIKDIVTCPGTDSCKLGITSSMGLNKALGEMLDTIDISDPLVNRLHIKASGCPNSCGQHHIANIGFHGAAMKGQGGQVPAYEIFLGGNYENALTEVGIRLKARVPAKKAPDALKALLGFYQKERDQDEPFNDFVKRLGKEPFESLLAEFRDVGPLDREHIEGYMDWGKTVLYKLERGEGECAI